MLASVFCGSCQRGRRKRACIQCVVSLPSQICTTAGGSPVECVSLVAATPSQQCCGMRSVMRTVMALGVTAVITEVASFIAVAVAVCSSCIT